MAACSRCYAPNADMFTPNGDLVCRFCFNTDQNAQADARARASLVADAPEGFKAEIGPGVNPPSPGKMIAGGLAVAGFGVLFGIGTVVFFGHIYPVWVALLVAGGLGTAARGLALRSRR